jgi:hypothetical protein
MFDGCYYLTNMPDIGHETTMLILGEQCFGYMFNGCKFLYTAPKLINVGEFGNSCCCCMFNGCICLGEIWLSTPSYFLEYGIDCFYKWTYGVKNDVSCKFYVNSSFYNKHIRKDYSGNGNGIPSNWKVIDIDTNNVLG